MSDTERRQFYRTQCQALIDCKQVDKAAIQQKTAADYFTDAETFALLSDFQRLDQECTQVASSLGKIDKNLLDYLSLTQRKIDQLSRLVLAQLPDINKLPHQTIDLSENGAGFSADRPFYLDSCLALRLVFLPQYLSVILFAKVVRCEPATESESKARDSFRIATEFLPLTEPTRRVIAQQVLRAQREAKLQHSYE